MAREPFRYDARTVALWAGLGVVIIVTSIAAIAVAGESGLYLVVTGWIVGPFVLYWLYKKIRAALKGR